ncbi:MAG: 30S ribosomal protein S6 [Candidatus Rokubacteria bacterium]|nr:30S ribosomal protein S6 [Candidatus Rokubacteria bacterium]
MSALHLYDVLIIVDPRHTEEEVAQLATRLGEACQTLGGEVASTENWGKRRLAYELRKQREGTYVLLQVKATPPVVREYERQLKLNESVLRFMTTRVEERRRKAAPRAHDELEGTPEAATESTVGPAAGENG